MSEHDVIVELREMDWSGVHDFYEDNRVELSKMFAEQRNKENELFSVASRQEAVVFLEQVLKDNGIKLKCDCIGRLGYMLVFSVDSLRL